MGSQPMRDRQSPSASTFLIPQLRQSRRGSLASLSSTSQLDKEALSQALDQIHSSASQTETLTTFNEYTSPPSSSSGPDSKGITSELHGGLSGLYTRFRASVGNVKDIVHLGSEEPVGETVSSANPKSPKGPASSTKNLGQPGPDTSSSAKALQNNSTSSLGQHSVASTADAETPSNEAVRQVKSSKTSLGSLSSKSASGSLGILKSAPTTLTQAAQTSTIRPALAEVNISAVKQGSITAEPPSRSASKSPVDLYHGDGNKRALDGLHIHTSNRASNASAITPSDALLSSTSTRSNGDQQAVRSDSNRIKNRAPNLYEPASERIRGEADRKQSKDRVQPFPGLEDDGYDQDAYAVTEASSDTDNGRAAPPRIVTSYGSGQDDFSESSERKRESAEAQMFTKQGGYQHLALPLRKTMAPPMVSRTDSTNPKFSRTSSYETDIDSVIDPVPRPSPSTEFGEASQTPKGKIITPRYPDPSASHQDLRTMNVFSQVKNKVLNKEYWMKDENARDCFYCGDSFTMVRRKHHCSKLATKQYI